MINAKEATRLIQQRHATPPEELEHSLDEAIHYAIEDQETSITIRVKAVDAMTVLHLLNESGYVTEHYYNSMSNDYVVIARWGRRV